MTTAEGESPCNEVNCRLWARDRIISCSWNRDRQTETDRRGEEDEQAGQRKILNILRRIYGNVQSNFTHALHILFVAPTLAIIHTCVTRLDLSKI